MIDKKEKSHIKADIPDWNRVIRIGEKKHIPQLVNIGERNKMRDLRELRRKR